MLLLYISIVFTVYERKKKKKVVNANICMLDENKSHTNTIRTRATRYIEFGATVFLLFLRFFFLLLLLLLCVSLLYLVCAIVVVFQFFSIYFRCIAESHSQFSLSLYLDLNIFIYILKYFPVFHFIQRKQINKKNNCMLLIQIKKI